MNKFLFPIYAVIAGFLIVLLFKPKKQRNIKLLLAFSGAFLLSITVFEILPEVFTGENTRIIGLCILLGILFQIILEFFSKGAEHGHIHIHKNKKIPWSLVIGLYLHAILEGLPIKQDNHLMYGILIHKLPIAIILSTFLFETQLKKWIIATILIVFAIMTPLGTIISNNTNLLENIEPYVTAVVVGTFLHISTVILFESTEEHKFNLNKLIAIIFGIGIAYFL
jgi:zinc transporter ZupT